MLGEDVPRFLRGALPLRLPSARLLLEQRVVAAPSPVRTLANLGVFLGVRERWGGGVRECERA